MSPHRPAFIPKENHRACQEHGASNQGDQPGLLKLSDEARLVVLVEPCHSAVLKETIERTYVCRKLSFHLASNRPGTSGYSLLYIIMRLLILKQLQYFT